MAQYVHITNVSHICQKIQRVLYNWTVRVNMRRKQKAKVNYVVCLALGVRLNASSTQPVAYTIVFIKRTPNTVALNILHIQVLVLNKTLQPVKFTRQQPSGIRNLHDNHTKWSKTILLTAARVREIVGPRLTPSCCQRDIY